jgi:hypothetical protein
VTNLEEKLREIQEYWLREARSRAGGTIKNFLDSVLMQLYIEPGQFILEFLQNAEDALMEAKKRGFFKIELYRDKIIIRHNGKPFNEQDLENLCSIRSSKKPSLGYKGFIGIGWKSAFKVSSKVEIYSKDASFKFDREYWKSEGFSLLEKYGLRPDEVLWQITPISIKPTEFAPEETKFIMFLEDESKYNDVEKTVEVLGPPLFLFLDYVSKVEVVDNVKGTMKTVEWFTVNEEEFEGAKVRQVIVTATEDKVPMFYKFLLFKKEVYVPEEVRRDDVTVNAKRSDVAKREVALAFALDPTTGDLKPIEEAKFYGVHSFLPLTGVRTGLKFLIQADFIVHPGRKYLNVEAKWNRWMIERIAELLRLAIKYLVIRYKMSYLTVFEYLELSDEAYVKLIRPMIIPTLCKELENPIVICYKGHEVKLDSALKASDDVLELVKNNILDEEELKYVYGSEKHILDPTFKIPDFPSKPYRIQFIELKELLDKGLVEAKLRKSVEEVSKFLREVYRRAREKTYIPDEKKFVLTTKGIDLAHNAYLPLFPPEVEDLRKKHSSIDEYLKALNFVRKDFTEHCDPELFKWLGVKEVTLKELIEKVVLKDISTEARPLEKSKLLEISLLAKRSGVVLEKPIWVVTTSGGIEKSNEVYYPLKELRVFEGYGEVMELLGLKVLDIDSYLKLDEDEEGWRRFFLKVIKGAEICHYFTTYYRAYYEPSPDYTKLVEKIKEVLEKASIEDNLKLVRFLKRVYEVGLKTCLERLSERFGSIKLITDDGKLVYSNECLLHDEYSPEEKWAGWRSKGFSIGPFVSPKYLEDASKVSSWREFFKSLGVKESVEKERDIVRRFAEWFVEKRLEERGYKVVSRGGEGYDLRVAREGEEVCVEVKGRRVEEEDYVLPEKESQVAHELKERYWLVVVEGIPNSPKAWLLKNPAKWGSKIVIPSRKFKEIVEEL